MSNWLKELKKLICIQSNYTYVKHVELYSCEDISDCESDSVSRELTLLSCIAINLSLTAAPLNFNFFLGRLFDLGFIRSGVAAGLLCFGVDISRIRTAVKLNTIYLDTGQLTIMPSMQSDQNGHWSHLSDLPSKGAPPGHTIVCDIVT